METQVLIGYITGLIQKTTLPIESLEVVIDEEKHTLWVRIKTSNIKYFSGKDNEHVEALNHLVGRIVYEQTAKHEHPLRAVVDINDAYEKQIEEIRSTAYMYASRVKYYQDSLEMPPMNAFERRIVHEYLQDSEDLSTESIGEGKERRIKIIFKK